MSHDAVVGIDPSSKAAHMTFIPFVGDSFSQTALVFTPKGKLVPSRTWDAYTRVRHYFLGIEEGGYTPRVYLEAPVLVKGAVQSMLAQAFISGAIQAGAESVFPESVEIVAPAEWKSEVLNKGNASKDDIKEHMLHVSFDFEADLAQDFYDSGAIALYGLGRSSGIAG